MARALIVSAAIVLAALTGCGAPRAKAPPVPVVNSVVVGKWAVASIDGKELAKGTEVHVEYAPNGKVTVQTTGDAAAVPPLDREELKQEMDKLPPARAGLLDDLKLTVGGSEVLLKWAGPEREVPAGPVPPKRGEPGS